MSNVAAYPGALITMLAVMAVLGSAGTGRSLLSLDTKIVVTSAALRGRDSASTGQHRYSVRDGLGESATGWRGKLDECPSFIWRGRLWNDHTPAVRLGHVSPPLFRSDLVFDDEFKRLVRLGAGKRPSYARQVEQWPSQSGFNTVGLNSTVAEFTAAVVTGQGFVYAADRDGGCLAVSNGACCNNQAGNQAGKPSSYRGPGGPGDGDGSVQWVDGTVITIAVSIFETAVFHFVLECLAAVALALPLLGDNETYSLHLSKRNPFVDQWLRIILPELPEDRIVTGVVGARRLLVPQQESGNPTPVQLRWMQARTRAFLAADAADAAHRPVTRPSGLPVVVTRTRSRVMPGWSAILDAIPHLDHTDSTALPPIAAQLRTFEASVVIAPHGAGLLNLLAAKPGACVFEFIPANPTVFNLCYARMSYYLGLKYYGFARNKVGKADADYVKDRIANACPV